MIHPRAAVAFRVIHDDDRPFLERVFNSTREWEFALTDWDPDEKADFLRRQFEAQDLHYRRAFPGAIFRIVVLDRTDIGRICLDRQSDALRIVEFTLLPEHRGRGIGTDILRSLMNEAHGGKVPVYLSVARGNPALRLYLRHGFVQIGASGHHLQLEWRPATGPREV